MNDNTILAENRYAPSHLAALHRFALGITIITILGHAYFGFEQSYAQPLVALATGYSLQLLLEAVDAWSSGRRPRFKGGALALVDFLLAPHITSLATAMLLYYNNRLWVLAFAVAAAIGSKTVFRAPTAAGSRHFFNPSNFGISVTLLLFPWVGIMFPWQFTAALGSVGDWVFPAVIVCLGTFINARYNKRLPLIAGFLAGFVVQVLLRMMLFDTPFLAVLAPVTGVAAMIYVFFTLPDPATTPERLWAQAAFGAAVAITYFVLVVLQIPFGLFFALSIVCAGRGFALYAEAIAARLRPAGAAAAAP